MGAARGLLKGRLLLSDSCSWQVKVVVPGPDRPCSAGGRLWATLRRWRCEQQGVWESVQQGHSAHSGRKVEVVRVWKSLTAGLARWN